MIRSPRAGKKPLILIIGGAVVVIAVLAGVLLGTKMIGARGAKAADKEAGKESGKEAGKDDSAEASKETASAEGGEKEAKKKDGEKPEKPEVVSLGDFLVNLRSQAGSHYLRTQVAISLLGLPKAEGEGKKGPALPASDQAIARDRVVTALSSVAYEQLKAPGGREVLRQGILKSLQDTLKDYEVKEVLFTEFVMQ